MTTDDLHASATRLYQELQRQPWFSAVVADELSMKLLIECKDMRKGSAYLPTGTAYKVPVQVVPSQAVVVRKDEEGEGMIS
jgi:hypothetical protein